MMTFAHSRLLVRAVSRWRQEMESCGLKLATVYAGVSKVSSFYLWPMADPQLSATTMSSLHGVLD